MLSSLEGCSAVDVVMAIGPYAGMYAAYGMILPVSYLCMRHGRRKYLYGMYMIPVHQPNWNRLCAMSCSSDYIAVHNPYMGRTPK